MIDDAPPLIAVRGQKRALSLPMVAIVGSRNASGAGLKFTQKVARDLAEAGFAICLRFGARDRRRRAWREPDERNDRLLAGGHDRVYPPEDGDFLDAILATGGALSEMPLGWEPRARDFPRRNRLISGLSVGVVIVEAAKRSGSRGWRSNKAVKCSPCRARRSIRAPRGRTGRLSRVRPRSPKPPT